MLKLRVVQAEFGDCLIVEFGTPQKPRYILIDGGPPTTYERHLKAELLSIGAAGGKLDLVVLSHVDNDHIIGLLDLMADLRQQRANGESETIAIDALWHNSFGRTIGSNNNIEARLKTLLSSAGGAAQAMTIAGMAVKGVGEGLQLRLAATALTIPINPGFAHDLITVDQSPQPKVFGNLTLRVVGPTQENLDELKTEWVEWLDEHENNIASTDPLLAAMADRSVPNLSSIMLLALADGKSMLLTSDGRGDHLLQGLKKANLLDAQGQLHVDVLKVAHHGSDRNATKKFFKAVIADQYVISADGKDDNPDLATLIWMVEAAKEQGRSIEIIVTNKTESTEKLPEEYDPAEYGYHMAIMKKGTNSMTVDLAP